MIKTIAFDADDTLWHNERIFIDAKNKYTDLLSHYHEKEWIEERLDETESRNISQFGYGVKGFTLSMIETAVELTEGRVTGIEISEIIGFAREMLSTPIEILEGVPETISELAPRYRLMVITKGDLFDQEAKISKSGLGDYFSEVEIVAEKTPQTYRRIAERYRIAPEEFLMVGNSLRSDILPAIEIGCSAVHIPYETEWFHERVDPAEVGKLDFVRLEKIAELPVFLKRSG